MSMHHSGDPCRGNANARLYLLSDIRIGFLRDHCGQVPHGRPPLVNRLWGEGHASALELPLV